MHPTRLKLERQFKTAKNIKPKKSTKITFDNHVLYVKEKNALNLELESILSKRKNPNLDLPIIINGLIDLARKNGYSTITGKTWIFAEHPKIAERMGISVDSKALEAYNALKKEYNILKIQGISKKIILSKSSFLLEKNIKFQKMVKTMDENSFSRMARNHEPYIIVNTIIKTEKGLKNKTFLLPKKLILFPFEIKL
jgi:hypothetical protein